MIGQPRTTAGTTSIRIPRPQVFRFSANLKGSVAFFSRSGGSATFGPRNGQRRPASQRQTRPLHAYWDYRKTGQALDYIPQSDNATGVNIREIIRDELHRRDWSQRELCRRADLLPHQMCEYLNSSRDIYVSTLERILKALELEITPATRRRRRK